MADPSFADRIASREVVIGVVGLGYVGLPLAVSYAESGFEVVGYDIAPGRVKMLNAGSSYVDDVPDERLGAVRNAERVRASDDARALSDVDVIFICVPTPFDRTKTPDLSYVREASETVGGILTEGMLVILQSTTYPGTTAEIVRPALEQGGLEAGTGFNLAFSPERVDPGNQRWSVHNTPKVVGGLTEACADRARLALEAVMDRPGLVTIVSSVAGAEMSKLLENTYRAVNIALVNEMAMLAHEMGIDIWEVIDAAATKPFGFEPFYPGVGPGGHCIPVDPYFLAWKAREFDFQSKFIELAADTNLRMAKYVVGRILDFMNRLERTLKGARVLCLGASFKPGVSDTRNSRAIRVMELLSDAGAQVDFSDPLVAEVELRSGIQQAVSLNEVRWDDFDLVVVLGGSPDVDVEALARAGVPMFDAVNAFGVGSGPLHERL